MPLCGHITLLRRLAVPLDGLLSIFVDTQTEFIVFRQFFLHYYIAPFGGISHPHDNFNWIPKTIWHRTPGDLSIQIFSPNHVFLDTYPLCIAESQSESRDIWGIFFCCYPITLYSFFKISLHAKSLGIA